MNRIYTKWILYNILIRVEIFLLGDEYAHIQTKFFLIKLSRWTWHRHVIVSSTDLTLQCYHYILSYYVSKYDCDRQFWKIQHTRKMSFNPIDFSPEQNMLVVLRQTFILYWELHQVWEQPSITLEKDVRGTPQTTLPHPCTDTKNRTQHHRRQFQHHRQGGPGAGQDHQGIYLHKGKNPTLNQNIGKYNLGHIWVRVPFNTPGLKLGTTQQSSTHHNLGSKSESNIM